MSTSVSGLPAGAGAAVFWDGAAFAGYDFGPSHPLRPIRLELTMALAQATGALAGATIIAPSPATDSVLELVHDPGYVRTVRSVAALADRPDVLFEAGLGTGDNPVFAGVHEASALVAGASVAAAEAVWTGTHTRAVNISGGLHHAMRDRASGFCVYDDPALAIAWLLAHGAERVAYVDVDVHHGDGVQDAFYGDPRVLTVSLHESGRTLFPGTGFPDEVGTGAGRGYSVNLGLPAGTGDDGWLRAFGAVVPPVIRAFRPQVLVTQHGCDTHALDPLAHLRTSIDGQRFVLRWLSALAQECAGGRWVALGGGGYDPVRVVPRAWTHLLAEVCGTAVDGDVPPDWYDDALRRTSVTPPTSMTDGLTPAYRPYDPGHPAADLAEVDREIAATRAATFPLVGLDPQMVESGVSFGPMPSEVVSPPRA